VIGLLVGETSISLIIVKTSYRLISVTGLDYSVAGPDRTASTTFVMGVGNREVLRGVDRDRSIRKLSRHGTRVKGPRRLAGDKEPGHSAAVRKIVFLTLNFQIVH
jgi:hypothetical protein